MTKIIERKGQEITLNDKTVTVKKSFNRISCRISGVIGHVIGKLIWVSGSGHKKAAADYHQILFPKKGKLQTEKS